MQPSSASKVETYRRLPQEGDKQETGWVRRRARSATGIPVNARMDLPWRDFWWVGENEFSEIACTICGSTLKEERLGVTWRDGEDRVRGINPKGGGYRSRGPVLWAMRVIKFERFGEEHMLCEQTFPDPNDRPPPDIAWLCIWGDACDMAHALHDRPELIVEYWEDWKLRDDVWKPAVRRRLRRAYLKNGADGVREIIGEGVAFKTLNPEGDKVSARWEFIPF